MVWFNYFYYLIFISKKVWIFGNGDVSIIMFNKIGYLYIGFVGSYYIINSFLVVNLWSIRKVFYLEWSFIFYKFKVCVLIYI